jgi:hypothetical protein
VAFLSIHPFEDGNGRLARLLVERILAEAGITAPLWTYIDEDVLMHPNLLASIIYSSTKHSIAFQRDLISLMRNDSFKAEISDKLLFHLLPADYAVGCRLPDDDRTPAISRAEFEEFKSVLNKRLSDIQAVKKYIDWVTKLNRCKNNYNPYLIQQNTLSLISDDYLQKFAVLSETAAHYQEKINTHYDKNSIYRGAQVDGNYTLNDVINEFTRITGLTAGVGVKPTRAAMIKTMQSFNERATDLDALLKDVIVHTQANSDKYWDSIFTSFSLHPVIAARFSATGEDADKYTASIIQARRPKHSFDSSYFINYTKSKIKSRPLFEEREQLVVGGLDPEAIESITLFNYTKNRDKYWSSIIQAKRLDYNTIEIHTLKPRHGKYLDTLDGIIAGNRVALATVIIERHIVQINPNGTHILISFDRDVPIPSDFFKY